MSKKKNTKKILIGAGTVVAAALLGKNLINSEPNISAPTPSANGMNLTPTFDFTLSGDRLTFSVPPGALKSNMSYTWEFLKNGNIHRVGSSMSGGQSGLRTLSLNGRDPGTPITVQMSYFGYPNGRYAKGPVKTYSWSGKKG